MERVDGHVMLLSLMATALVASLISRWISVPLYGAVSQAQRHRLPQPAADIAAETPLNIGAIQQAPT